MLTRACVRAQAAALASAKRSFGARHVPLRRAAAMPDRSPPIARSIQLCINVQLPPEFGGMAGEAIYIGATGFLRCFDMLLVLTCMARADTEGSFMPERACDMAAAAGAHLRALAATASMLGSIPPPTLGKALTESG